MDEGGADLLFRPSRQSCLPCPKILVMFGYLRQVSRSKAASRRVMPCFSIYLYALCVASDPLRGDHELILDNGSAIPDENSHR